MEFDIKVFELGSKSENKQLANYTFGIKWQIKMNISKNVGVFNVQIHSLTWFGGKTMEFDINGAV